MSSDVPELIGLGIMVPFDLVIPTLRPWRNVSSQIQCQNSRGLLTCTM